MDQATPTVIEPDDEAEERDRPFNAYRFAASEISRAIVQEAIRRLLNCEARFQLKKNKRRAKDQETFDLTVDAILSDLMHHHLVEYPTDIYVTRSNRVLGAKSRYRPRAYSKMFPYILDLMAKPEMAYIEQDIAAPVEGVSRSTVIRPGSRLLDRIEEHGVQLGDLGEHPHGETIILKRSKDRDDYWDEGGLEEYDDTPETERYRAELEEINQWIADADLRFNPDGLPWPRTQISIHDRRLRRVFTQSRFDSGGRLFGGFWQSLRKHERRQRLWISGERAVELDYGQVGPRILYGMAGHKPPFEDLYDIWGYGLNRPGIKKVMSAMIFASDPLSRFPKDTRPLFSRSYKVGDVVTAIEAKHSLIKDRFHRGLGHDAQFIESEIMVEVLLTLKASGAVALPIHDAVMVPASAVSMTREIMLDTFHRHVHVEGTVTMEG
ncbi:MULTISPECIES: hypothetical protein [unclassified Mesorhizobium]|uniref:hypothetical protein n=1 Tax=unclassified Mesorhizobium TaxID=325217 RepID=UPI001127B3FF|nr:MULTISPECIES: hypothetical protein [unclassified Mesorhizobium]TPK99041.1 hypothetical protein FJ567_17335 [Mesorhizobium sp. B2-4-16]TPL59473.1 hypothetical protein FJ956_28565 [Mesorhizobium sp. B2-4-3]